MHGTLHPQLLPGVQAFQCQIQRDSQIVHGSAFGQEIAQVIFAAAHDHPVSQHLYFLCDHFPLRGCLCRGHHLGFRQIQPGNAHVGVGLLRKLLVQNGIGPIVDLPGGLVGPERVIDLQPVALIHRVLRGHGQLLCRGVKQRHQEGSIPKLHLFISAGDNTGDLGNLKFMDHVNGIVAVGDLVFAQIAQILRQIDHAVIAVDVHRLPVQPDAEHTVPLLQNAIGRSGFDFSHRFGAGGISIGGEVLGGPDGGINGRFRRGEADRVGDRRVFAVLHGLAAHRHHPVREFLEDGKMAAGIAALSVPGNLIDCLPHLGVAVHQLDLVVLALGLVPGQRIDIIPLAAAFQIQIPAQQVIPGNRHLSGPAAVEFHARFLPVSVKGHPAAFAKVRHRVIPLVAKGQRQHVSLEVAGLNHLVLRVQQVEPDPVPIPGLEVCLDRLAVRIRAPLKFRDPGSGIYRGYLQRRVSIAKLLAAKAFIFHNGTDPQRQQHAGRKLRQQAAGCTFNIVLIEQLRLFFLIFGRQQHFHTVVVCPVCLRPAEHQVPIRLLLDGEFSFRGHGTAGTVERHDKAEYRHGNTGQKQSDQGKKCPSDIFISDILWFRFHRHPLTSIPASAAGFNRCRSNKRAYFPMIPYYTPPSPALQVKVFHPSRDKFRFVGMPPQAMRARCGWFRYFPAPLGIVTAIRKYQFNALLIHRWRPSITTAATWQSPAQQKDIKKS